jgi:4-aminobutyrate aminotransferase-like enzyme
VTSPDETVRKIIEESVAPRLAEYQDYLAAADPDPVPVARAELVYIWDDYHQEYVDWASLGNPLGHGHPMLTGPVSEHHRYYGLTAPQGRHAYRWVAQYARDLSGQFTGHGEAPRKVLFTEGEREAVLQAIRLAVNTTSSLPEVLSVGGSYDWMPSGCIWYPPVFDPADAAWDRVSALLLNMADESAHVIRPGQARRWMLAAREAGKPVIVDETLTGFGRLGRMWGYLSTGISPDIVILGGPAGGGYPLGAVVASPEAFEGFTIDVSGQSGNPVSCCAGASTLTTIGMGALDYMIESGQILSDGLDEVLDQFGSYLDGHHGEGHLRGLRFRSVARAGQFVADARNRGLSLAPPVAATVVLAPALITSTYEIKRGLDIIADILLSWDGT